MNSFNILFTAFLIAMFSSLYVTQQECPLTEYHHNTYELIMVAHQARGVIFIDSNICGFEVSRLEVAGFEGLTWWASNDLTLQSIVNGIPLNSDSSLKNDQFNASQKVSIPQSAWSDFQSMKIISLWIPSEARLVGYIQLDSNQTSATMFQHCLKYAQKSQIRWNINFDQQNPELSSADFAFEGHLAEEQYQSIGFPLAKDNIMGGADSITYGVVNDTPFALDFFFPTYGVCTESSPGKFGGVCTDLQLGRGNPMYDNVNMTYWQHLEGTWLITANRLLNSTDRRFDLDINPFDPMKLLWAAAGFYVSDNNVPMLNYHGASFGFINVTLQEGAADKQSTQCELIYDPLAISSGSTHLIEAESSPLKVTLGPKTSLNPLQPENVIYIDGLATPTIIAVKGQKLEFKLDSGVSMVITDSQIGGEYIKQSKTFASGTGQVSWVVGEGVKNSHGVYYQSPENPLMGGQILFGGKEDDGQIFDFKATWDSLEVEWMLEGEGEDTMMTWSVEATKPAGWICIGFGSMMKGGYAYVGWMDESDQGRIQGYHMSGQTPGSTHYDADAQILNPVIEKDGVTNRLKMSFQRRFLTPSIHEPNIDGEGEIDMIWAYGQTWTQGQLTHKNIHSARGVEIVNLLSGKSRSAPVAKIWLIHGVLMFVAWSVLIPLAVFVARYFKAQLGPTWMTVHKYCNILGLLVSLAALAIVIYEMQVVGAEHFITVHTKIGLAVSVVGVHQGVQGFIRPAKPGPDGAKSDHLKRNIWCIPHKFVGFSLVILSQAAIITGLEALELKNSGETIQWQIAAYAWIGFIFVCGFMFQCRQMVTKMENSATESNSKESSGSGNGSVEFVELSKPVPEREIPNIEEVEIGSIEERTHQYKR